MFLLASLSMSAMKFALKRSKTSISSSSSSALLLFGTSLLTSMLKRTFAVFQDVIAFKKFQSQQRFLALRFPFLANWPASDVCSTWATLVYQDTSNRHHVYSSLLRFGSRYLVVDEDLFRPGDFIELAFLTRSAGSVAP